MIKRLNFIIKIVAEGHVSDVWSWESQRILNESFPTNLKLLRSIILVDIQSYKKLEIVGFVPNNIILIRMISTKYINSSTYHGDSIRIFRVSFIEFKRWESSNYRNCLNVSSLKKQFLLKYAKKTRDFQWVILEWTWSESWRSVHLTKFISFKNNIFLLEYPCPVDESL